MPNIKVSLGIGYVNANHEEVIEINDDEWDECETDMEREDLMND